MAVLKNARHEKFAQARAGGMTVDQAYVHAGYREHRSNAARLSAKEEVRARIEEIQAVGAEKAAIDAAWVVEQLRLNYMRATGQLAVRVGFVDEHGEPLKCVDEEGNEEESVRNKLFSDAHAANKALELLGKTCQAFKDDDNNKGGPAVIVQFPPTETKSGS